MNEFLIASHNEEWQSGNITECVSAYLYLVNNRYYEVEYEHMGTSGGIYSTTWNATRDVFRFDSLEKVQEYYGKHFFKAGF